MLKALGDFASGSGKNGKSSQHFSDAFVKNAIFNMRIHQI